MPEDKAKVVGYDPTVPRNKIDIVGESHTKAKSVRDTPGKTC